MDGYLYKLECKRHAPIVVVSRNINVSIFPVVKAASWCGDFKAGQNEYNIEIPNLKPSEVPK